MYSRDSKENSFNLETRTLDELNRPPLPVGDFESTRVPDAIDLTGSGIRRADALQRELLNNYFPSERQL